MPTRNYYGVTSIIYWFDSVFILLNMVIKEDEVNEKVLFRKT